MATQLNPFKKRTRPLQTGRQLMARRAAAVGAARRRDRCDECGSFRSQGTC